MLIVEEILKLYLEDKLSIRDIAKANSCGKEKISKILKDNNIEPKKKSFFSNLSDEEKQELIIMYIDKEMTTSQIGKVYNVSPQTIQRALEKLSIDRRDGKFQRQYNIDENFFEKINTEEKAYWLGFMYADGNVSKTEEMIDLTLSIEDLHHVEKFKNSIKSEHNINIISGIEEIYPNRKKYIRKDRANLRIGCTKMAHDLTKLGCIPAKSLILTYPSNNQVPLELQHHFIRGIFDGDGCIYFNIEYNNINIIGTKNLLEGIKNFIETEQYKVSLLDVKDKNYYRLQIASKIGIIDFYNKIYKDATIYLDRKYNKFQQFLHCNGGDFVCS